MGCQNTAVLCVIAGNMSDDRETARGLVHHGLQRLFPVLHRLVDAFSRRPAHIDAFHSLVHKVPGQGPHSVPAYLSRPVVAGVKCRDDSPVFVKLHSYFTPVISESFTFLFSNRDLVQASAVAMAFLAASPVSRALNSSSGWAPCMILLKYSISSYMML